jgi:hypothetical protein
MSAKGVPCIDVTSGSVIILQHAYILEKSSHEVMKTSIPLPTRTQPQQGQTWDYHVHTLQGPRAPWNLLGAFLIWLLYHKA